MISYIQPFQLEIVWLGVKVGLRSYIFAILKLHNLTTCFRVFGCLHMLVMLRKTHFFQY